MATRREIPNDSARFGRWPGLLSLSLGVILGPIAALANQEMIYVTNMWACGTGSRLAMHIVPLVCLIVAVGAGLLARADWARLGGGTEDEAATVDSRSRFLALAGMAASAISALLILAQWLAIFVFGPCMRS